MFAPRSASDPSSDRSSGRSPLARIAYRVAWIAPWPLKPSLRAVAAVRSYSRPPTYGPRSITRTRTTRPRWRIVTLVPHGSDLFATPTVPAQPPAATQIVAEQARPVPRGLRVPVDVQAADHAGRAGIRAHARTRAERAADALAQDVAARGAGAVTVEGHPAPTALDLQFHGARCGDATLDGHAAAGLDVQSLRTDADFGSISDGRRKRGRGRSREAQCTGPERATQRGSRHGSSCIPTSGQVCLQDVTAIPARLFPKRLAFRDPPPASAPCARGSA